MVCTKCPVFAWKNSKNQKKQNMLTLLFYKEGQQVGRFGNEWFWVVKHRMFCWLAGLILCLVHAFIVHLLLFFKKIESALNFFNWGACRSGAPLFLHRINYCLFYPRLLESFISLIKWGKKECFTLLFPQFLTKISMWYSYNIEQSQPVVENNCILCKLITKKVICTQES